MILGHCACYFLFWGMPSFYPYSFYICSTPCGQHIHISIHHPPTHPCFIHPSNQPINQHKLLYSCYPPGLLLFLPHQPCPPLPSPEEPSFLPYDVILTSLSTGIHCAVCLHSCLPLMLVSSSRDGACLHSTLQHELQHRA